MATDERERAIREIADTSRYDASTAERDLDAECALSAMEAAGLIVVEKGRLEAAEQRVHELEREATEFFFQRNGTDRQREQAEQHALLLQELVNRLEQAAKGRTIALDRAEQRICELEKRERVLHQTLNEHGAPIHEQHALAPGAKLNVNGRLVDLLASERSKLATAVEALVFARGELHRAFLERGSTDGYGASFQRINAALSEIKGGEGS